MAVSNNVRLLLKLLLKQVATPYVVAVAKNNTVPLLPAAAAAGESNVPLLLQRVLHPVKESMLRNVDLSSNLQIFFANMCLSVSYGTCFGLKLKRNDKKLNITM